jgi:hypothetical protein
MQVIRGYIGDKDGKPVFDTPTPFDVLGTGWAVAWLCMRLPVWEEEHCKCQCNNVPRHTNNPHMRCTGVTCWPAGLCLQLIVQALVAPRLLSTYPSQYVLFNDMLLLQVPAPL